jgi:hypothetical protein
MQMDATEEKIGQGQFLRDKLTSCQCRRHVLGLCSFQSIVESYLRPDGRQNISGPDDCYRITSCRDVAIEVRIEYEASSAAKISKIASYSIRFPAKFGGPHK